MEYRQAHHFFWINQRYSFMHIIFINTVLFCCWFRVPIFIIYSLAHVFVGAFPARWDINIIATATPICSFYIRLYIADNIGNAPHYLLNPGSSEDLIKIGEGRVEVEYVWEDQHVLDIKTWKTLTSRCRGSNDMLVACGEGSGTRITNTGWCEENRTARQEFKIKFENRKYL